MDAAIRLAKIAVNSLRASRYNRAERTAVETILSAIATERGPLKPFLRKQADDYAREVLGWIEHSPWLYVYSAVAGAFHEGWIPDSYYGKIVVPAMQGDYGMVSHHKPLTRRLFNSSSIPDVAYFVNGIFYSPNLDRISDANIKAALFENSPKVVFKIDNSERGNGISVFTPQGFDLAEIKARGNGVFQQYIDQHDFFSSFSRSSVATLRMTTAVDDAGHCSLRGAYLRIGRDRDTHVQSNSAIRIAVDPQTGALAGTGYLPTWLTTNFHPDSQTRFAGSRIPSFDKCIATALELQKQMPFVRCIGWDVVIDKANDVRVMEWNGHHNDIRFLEATQGPCFRGLRWEALQSHQR